MTYKERILLKFIIQRLEVGECPGLRDMARYMGFTAHQSANSLLGRLEEGGFVRRPAGEGSHTLYVTDLGYNSVGKTSAHIKHYYRLKGATDNACPAFISVTAEWSSLRRD